MLDMEILPFGDSALLINFEQKISRDINNQVMHLAGALEVESVIDFVTPSYCSLLVGFDAMGINYGEVKKMVLEKIKLNTKFIKKVKGRKFKIPVCYHKSLSLDMGSISKITGLRRKEIIKLHTKKYYRVFLVGFLPGFCYLGVLPKVLRCSRHESPRQKVPKGAVGIAGGQTGIYPAAVPGGWQIVGQTPIDIFRPLADTPFLFRTGDEIKFFEISLDEFSEISQEIESDIYDWSKLAV